MIHLFWASWICIYCIAYTCRIVVITRKSRIILQHLSSNTTWSKLIDNKVAYIIYSRQSWMINDQKVLLELFIFCKEILITSYSEAIISVIVSYLIESKFGMNEHIENTFSFIIVIHKIFSLSLVLIRFGPIKRTVLPSYLTSLIKET